MKGIVNKLISIYFFLSILLSVAKGQEATTNYNIQWASDTVKSRTNLLLSKQEEFPRFLPEKYHELPLVYLKIPVNWSKNTVNIHINKFSEAVFKTDDEDKKLVKEAIELTYSTVYENKIPYLLISFVPILKNANGFIKVDEYNLQINPVQELGKPNQTFRAYKTNSVLASGEWYKIAVKEEGIYKLSYDFLKNLGINVNAIDARNIRIYGNGGTILPQKNASPRIDDLQENVIKVIGEADGKLDNNDYVLFYASGNTKWTLNSNQNYFEHQINTYTDSSYYFINVDLGLGKRIANLPSATQTPNYISSEFDEHLVYEKDLYSIITSTIKSGRNWYGEDFEFNATRNFDFDITGIQSNAPVFLRTDMVIRAGTNSSASVKLNNQLIYNLNANALPLSFETDYGQPVSGTGSLSGLSGNNLSVGISYNKPNSVANAWLNYLEVNFRRQLNLNQNFLRFRDLKSVGAGNINQFNVSNVIAGTEIWDVTDPLSPIQQLFGLSGQTASFSVASTVLKEFAVFTPASSKTPTAIGKILNQNLHALAQADLLIITPSEWFSEAKRLGNFRKSEQNLSYQIVTPNQIFNEFSSGGREATAIRDFVKMFYDRAGFNPNLLPKYLLLFGKGSFDNRMIKFKDNNFIVTYQSENSLSPTQSYTSDDYFGLLDDNEGAFPEDFVTNPGLLDIAVGRIPVKSITEAKNVVDKLISYSSVVAFGDWRNQFTIVADDEDNNLHLNQAEANAALLAQRTAKPNIDKIYFDAYQQESFAGGNRYPEVREAINQKVNSGSLMINYTGHGGENGWAEERVLTVSDISSWDNPNNLPIIFTATCSFSRWDDPEITSAGELTLLRKNAGVPGLFSTTRVVFASYNFDLNQSFLRALYQPTNFNKKVSFGEVFKAAKNTNIGGLNINSRNFTLLGDPSTLFPIPINNIITSTINNKSLNIPDTLKAGQKVNIKGILTDTNGNKLSNFNGFIFPSIYDKPTSVTTLGQDKQLNGSYPQTFNVQKNLIYKGKVTVTNGNFSFDFIVPKDINLQVGKGKISYYANNTQIDASGYTDLKIGGISNAINNDKIGPEIRVFLNDENFVSGGITNTKPVLLVKLSDESGINTTGIGIGHDIVATLSPQNAKDKTIILNDFYQADLDSYQKGKINYPISELAPGFYTLKIKAWDVFNNSSEQSITFEVKQMEKLVLAHVLNYPNPFTTKTSFQFEHNHPNEELEVQINIRSVSGKLIKTINQLVNSSGNRVNNIFWDARDDFGEKIGRGVYIYEIKVRSSLTGDTVQKIEKLVLL